MAAESLFSARFRGALDDYIAEKVRYDYLFETVYGDEGDDE